MKQMSSYPVRISRSADIRKTLSATAGIYRKAVEEDPVRHGGHLPEGSGFLYQRLHGGMGDGFCL